MHAFFNKSCGSELCYLPLEKAILSWEHEFRSIVTRGVLSSHAKSPLLSASSFNSLEFSFNQVFFFFSQGWEGRSIFGSKDHLLKPCFSQFDPFIISLTYLSLFCIPLSSILLLPFLNSLSLRICFPNLHFSQSHHLQFLSLTIRSFLFSSLEKGWCSQDSIGSSIGWLCCHRGRNFSSWSYKGISCRRQNCWFIESCTSS